ncbi:MAG: ParA family protein [Gemmatimonadetes bacterium]|nr:ParA family protein [Gemmatimonadota bacterium]
MSRVIAVANQKGGVGKTTTAVSIASSLAIAERRTLLLDADPQSNATSGVGVVPGAREGSTYDVLLDPDSIKRAIIPGVLFDNLDLLPSSPDLSAAELDLADVSGRERQMAVAVALVRNAYDYIIIDCPPSLGIITVNMLAAADAVLIPLQCEYYALEGLSHLLRTVDAIRAGINPALEIEGVALTMFDSRLNLSRQVAEDARKHFGDLVFQSVVPRNIRLAEAPSFGRPIVSYDIGSVGAQAYLAIARELMERVETPALASK